MSLVQIVAWTGVVSRVPNGETPVVKLELDANQSIIGLELRPMFSGGRKTTDWRWQAMIATRL